MRDLLYIALAIVILTTGLFLGAAVYEKIKQYPPEATHIHRGAVAAMQALQKQVGELRALSDKRCVGSIDTIGRSDYYGSWLVYYVDTTWILCCDSAARGISPIDTTYRQRSNGQIDTMIWSITETIDRRYTLQHPERWYIKSVDTILRCTHNNKHGGLFGPLPYICRPLFDTTWAKKIPLSEVWVTPYEKWKLRQLLKGFWVDRRWSSKSRVQEHLERFDNK